MFILAKQEKLHTEVFFFLNNFKMLRIPTPSDAGLFQGFNTTYMLVPNCYL